MALRSYRSMIPAVLALLAGSACGGHAVPSSSDAVSAPLQASRGAARPIRLSDSRSILQGFTKDVVIGSTVDAKNGDQAPRALNIVGHGLPGGILKTGQLVVCNYADSSGVQGNGTTIEALNPKPGATAIRYVQTDLVKGCVGAAVHPHHSNIYGAGFTSDKVVVFDPKGKVQKVFSGKTVTSPLGDIVAKPNQNFSPLYVYLGTTKGGLVSISVGFYGNQLATEVAKGFAVSNGSQSELGPTGLQYDHGSDTLYIVDGVTNTVVAFTNASKLLVKDEIIVQPGGKTFKCRYKTTTCGELIFAGSPLNAPVASALLPNGNLIVANTGGTANTLVELTPGGQVLATKVVDTSSTQGVFGLAASGTNDNNTVLFYTDTNDNNIHELKP